MTRRPKEKAVPAVYAANLDGLQVIEASAGTGKTWTIAGLYLRLLLEKQAPVEGILAITFTRAATAELRERVRARLQQLLDALEGRSPGDDLVRWLVMRIADRPRAHAHLTATLRGFDEAPIQTIHGFCQRALAEHAFSSGVAFDCELVPDIGDVLHEVAADFWRSRFAASPELQVSWMLDTGRDLPSLEKWAWKYVRREGLELRRPAQGASLEVILGNYRAVLEACSAAWRGQSDTITALLTGSGLHRSRYSPPQVAVKLDAVSACLDAAGRWTDIGEHIAFFAQERVDAAATSKSKPVKHPFFAAASAMVAACTAASDALARDWSDTCLDFVVHARERISQRLAERNAQSYDDLLLKLHTALLGPSGAALVQALRQRYPYALIDEFQDTDPVQWGVFESIYAQAEPARHAAFLVGDPKQAIYGFRGADVYAYLDAVSRQGAPLRLLENQRSVPGMVRALNTLFGFAEAGNPFRHARIRYEDVDAAQRPKAALVEGKSVDVAPLRIAFAGAQANGKPQNKDQGHAWAAAVTVAEIERLLFGGADRSIRLGDRPLRASDIAVLVKDRFGARHVRDALAARGISCAEISSQSVFSSAEAEQLVRVLLAVAAPKDAGRLRAALVTDLIGLPARELLDLEHDQAWEAVLAEFDGYHEAWRSHGLMRMLRELFRQRRVPESLARLRDGERRLTNLYHLCELLHQEEQQLRGLDALVSWLAGRRDETVTEEAQLRLESDANLVQIVTIHTSKGLEYPVTFVPFLWDAKSYAGEAAIVEHHSAQPPHGMVLDAGSVAIDAARDLARDEELAERVRLAYVALTRARNRCYVCTGALSSNEYSALGWLIHGVDGGQANPALPDESALRAQVERLCEQGEGDIALLEASPSQAALLLPEAPGGALAARKLRRAIPGGFTLTSFSSLRESQLSQDENPLPDHDQGEEAQAAASPPLAPGGQRFSFPKGRDAGICLHAMLEHADFAAPVAASVVREQLQRAGYPSTWGAEVAAWLGEVAQVALPDPAGGEPVRLADLAAGATFREMAFNLCVHDFSPRRIAAIAAQHGVPVPELSRETIRGYLSGFIDLVFRHGERWYVADYKSNWLGAERAAYGAEAVAEAMAEGDYHLQYLLYTLALHRWLRSRVPGYDYERHWGGTLYLFLRGMHPEWRDEQGLPSGVFATRPPRALIQALDECLGAVPIEEAAA
ncbi:MAG TPA: exodeoxyribonuclease V subunit beta [Solimonas sp.]|nr:exodeoxyribonuclease V subunit beta [Solimonas sp.]